MQHGRDDHFQPKIISGKPVVAGTRITVESILERLGAGESIEDLLEAHPRLTREGVQAALRFGATAIRAYASARVPTKPLEPGL